MEREMHTKVVGVSFDDRQENVKLLLPGMKLYAVHETDNPFDPHAIKLYADDQCTKAIGYVGRELAKDLKAQAHHGWMYSYFVKQVTGDIQKTLGVNIVIKATRPDA